jgi:hypothetical protein
MRSKVLVVALAAMCVGVTATAASAKKYRHHVRKPVVEAVDPTWDVWRNFWGTRCTTDEGYGRRLPCDYGGK